MINIGNDLPTSNCFYGRWGQYIPLYAAHGRAFENAASIDSVYKWYNVNYLRYEDDVWGVHPYYSGPLHREQNFYRIMSLCVAPRPIFTHPHTSTQGMRTVRRKDSVEAIEGIGHWGYQNKARSSDKLFFHKFFHSTYNSTDIDVHFSMMIDVRYVKLYRLSMFAGELPDARWFKLIIDKEYYRTAGRSKVGKWLKSKVTEYTEKGLTIEYMDNISDTMFAKVQAPTVKSIREYKDWISNVHSQFITEL